MSRKVLVLALALAATACSKKEKPAASEAANERPRAVASAAERQEPAVAERPAPGQEPEQARKPVTEGQPWEQAGAEGTARPSDPELDQRERRVMAALEKAKLGPLFSETLPTRLGNLDACRPIERRRFNITGDELYVIVSTYPTEEAAEACLSAYAALVGPKWPRYQGDFWRKGRFVLEVNPKMEPAAKERLKAAAVSALD